MAGYKNIDVHKAHQAETSAEEEVLPSQPVGRYVPAFVACALVLAGVAVGFACRSHSLSSTHAATAELRDEVEVLRSTDGQDTLTRELALAKASGSVAASSAAATEASSAAASHVQKVEDAPKQETPAASIEGVSATVAGSSASAAAEATKQESTPPAEPEAKEHPKSDSNDSPVEAKVEVRVCRELPSTRLGEGEGWVDGSGTEGISPSECTELCRKASSCGQSIYSSGNQGCYLFKTAVIDLAPQPPDEGSTDVYTSALCGSAVDMAVQALDIKKARLAEVQKSWDEAQTRAQTLLAQLQPDAKFALLAGAQTESGFAGFVDSSRAAGAPALRMNDGPQGFNIYTDASLAGTATQFPCLLAVAASFDPEVSRRYAAAIVEEFVKKGSNVLLGPDLEVTRVSSTGRSFESLSGEDPHLGAQLVGPFIEEVQSKGIMATIKHWLDNNQEIGRMTMNVEVDDRTQHEIYMPPFQAAIDAGAGAVMCAYNKVYGTYACENQKLLKELLRDHAGFKGFVMSDWGATHDAKRSVESGLDVEMPGGFNGEFAKIPQLVGEGAISQEQVDEMATHVLTAMYHTGMFDDRFPGQAVAHVSADDVTTDAHRQVAREIIASSAVLLKNEDATLPLDTAGKKIAFIGKYCHSAQYIPPDHVTANDATPFMGQGSGYVQTSKTVTPFQEFKKAVEDAASITSSDDASAGEGADVAIVCASDCDVHEGWDRMNFSLPEAQELVTALRKQGGQKKVVMLGITPGAVTTEWIGETDATLILFMPGEQVGAAVADLLTGAASPGGRLPITMPPNGWKPIGGYPVGEDHMFLSEQYPGVQPPPHDTYKWGDHLTANFSEGMLVGYRWWDAKEKKPAFPFGYGLTYTDFVFEDMHVACSGQDIAVSLTVSNTGKRDGDAVPQLYVSFPSLKPALRQLKGFQKVHLPRGGSAGVQFVLDQRDVSYFDIDKKAWVSAWEKGEKVTISIGDSSANLALHREASCASAK